MSQPSLTDISVKPEIPKKRVGNLKAVKSYTKRDMRGYHLTARSKRYRKV